MTPIEKMMIELECARLALQFGLYVDQREAERCAALFSEDGSFERRGLSLKGRDVILKAFLSQPDGVLTRHHCLPPHIDVVDQDTAKGITPFASYRHESAEPLTGPAPLAGPDAIGEYHDVFVRTPEGWRIASRRSQLVFLRSAG